MFRILYSDLRKILKSAALKIGIAAIAGYLFVNVLTIKIVGLYMHIGIYTDDFISCFPEIAIFLITASTLLITVGDFSDGCMRNKIISGISRTDIAMSALIGGMFQGFLYSFAACIFTFLLGAIFGKGLNNYTVGEYADFWIINTMTCMAIGAFSTILIIILGGKKISYVIGLAFAFVMKVFTMDVLDKLFPESGHCSLSGAKLAIYSFFEKYVPYIYQSVRPHYSYLTYFIGCGGLVLISVILGIIVFNKKEIQ